MSRRWIARLSTLLALASPLWAEAAAPPDPPGGTTLEARPRTYTARPHNSRRLRNAAEVQMRDASYLHNQQRRLDVRTIGGALFSYKRDHEGKYPFTFPLSPVEICGSDAKDCKGLLELHPHLKTYVRSIPTDPLAPKDGNGAGYALYRDWRGRVFITAPLAEDGAFIKEQR